MRATCIPPSVFSAQDLENVKLLVHDNIQTHACTPDFCSVYNNSNKKTTFVVPSSESKTFLPKCLPVTSMNGRG